MKALVFTFVSTSTWARAMDSGDDPFLGTEDNFLTALCCLLISVDFSVNDSLLKTPLIYTANKYFCCKKMVK